MNKITFLLLTAGLAVASYAAEFSEESLIKALETGYNSFLEPPRKSYNKSDMDEKEKLIKSLGLSYDENLFKNKITADDYKITTKFNVSGSFKASELSLEELNNLFGAWKKMIQDGKINADFTPEKMILKISEMIFKSDTISIEKLNVIFKHQSELVDQMIASKMSIDPNKLVNCLTSIISDSTNLSKKQLELVFEQYDVLFNKFDINNDKYIKSSTEGLNTILASIKTKIEKANIFQEKTDSNIEFAISYDKNIGWVKDTIKDPYIKQAREFLYFDSKLWSAWRKIFESKPKPVEKIGYKVPNGKFIFEVWTPENKEQKENLLAELEFAKSKGYIGVVVMWDGTSDYKELVKIQEEIRSRGLKIWLGFSPYKGYIENNKVIVNKDGKKYTKHETSMSTFVEPIYYKEGLKALAVNSEAFLMGWRRTSLHHNTQNVEWQNYTMGALRDGNPKIGFIGEFYYGENGYHPYYHYGQYANYRENYDAVLVVNYGYISVNPKWAIATARRYVGIEPQLVCVIQGVKPGYITYSDRHITTKKRTKEQYMRINELLEKRFLKAGFDAVCGLTGDGLNSEIAPDNMCMSCNRNPSKEKF